MREGSFLYVILLLAITGCTPRTGTMAQDGELLYEPEYAVGFSIHEYGDSSSVVTIKNPWQGAQGVEKRLFLSRGGEQPPEGFEGVVADAPLRRVVCMSSSYMAFIDALGEIDAVKAVSGAGYVTNDTIKARYARSEVRDVGYDANMNYELIATLEPDLVMIYGVFGENSVITDRLGELGVKVIYIGDYVEQSPLGRAEWVVAFGEMFDKRTEGEQLFGEIRKNYLATRELVAGSDGVAPSVMINTPYRDTWFVPGDRSYMVRLIVDAGGAYACAGVDSEQSRPISGESAFVFASEADVWLNPGQVSTLGELRSLNPRFGAIQSVENGRVFNNTLRDTPDGGSDFWESGAVRPDVVLRDVVRILHPKLLPEHKLYYFKQLK